MIKVRYNTNYGVLPDQKRWRVLIDGEQIFTDSIEINTKSWTTKDLIKGDDGNYVDKYHITCNPDIVKNKDGNVQLKDYDDSEISNDQQELICINWSVSENKWKVNIKEIDRYFEEILFKTKVWTSDISPELCCRPKHIGIANDTKLYLSDKI